MNRFQEVIQLRLNCPICHSPLLVPPHGHTTRKERGYCYKYYECHGCEITLVIRGRPEC